MNSPKEIANRVLEIQERGKFEHLNFGDHQFKEAASIELARAYLELEKNLEAVNFQLNEHRQLASYRLHHGIKLESEITKLKKSREGLRKQLSIFSKLEISTNVSYDTNIGKKAREALKADDEIMGEGK